MKQMWCFLYNCHQKQNPNKEREQPEQVPGKQPAAGVHSTNNFRQGDMCKSNKRDLETSILGHLGSILRLLAPSWLYHVSYTTKCDHTWSKCGVFVQLSPKTRPQEGAGTASQGSRKRGGGKCRVPLTYTHSHTCQYQSQSQVPEREVSSVTCE